MTAKKGFTLLEVMLVVVIFGVTLSMVLPRAMRAGRAAKFSIVRQHATEIGGHTMIYAQETMESSGNQTGLGLADYLLGASVENSSGGVKSYPALTNRYTGSNHFDVVEKLVDSSSPPRNPFNQVSYFSQANNDESVFQNVSGFQSLASRRPGLLYLATANDPKNHGGAYRMFYYIFTDYPRSSFHGSWYGAEDQDEESFAPMKLIGRSLTLEEGRVLANEQDPGFEWDTNSIRRGVFVSRLPDTRR